MSLGAQIPARAGGINELVLHTAEVATRVAYISQLFDARWGTLQKTPAPICHTDLIPPFPYPQHPLVPMPGDPGAYATAAALEDM